jgi:dTDP-4-dehydrorhamnose 3,5-epimerase
MQPLGIDGAWLFTPQIHTDNRGSFLEWFRGIDFVADLGYSLEITQANCSTSRRGVIRGIHFADVPPGQAKYVTCVSGAVLDVAVDVRVGSPSYGRWEAVRLDDEARCALFLSEGLGHAFMALSDQATVLYLCSTPYAAEREHGINPLDPALRIPWPGEAGPLLSGKDSAAPTASEARRRGMLPDYDSCLMHVARMRGVVRAAPGESRAAGDAGTFSRRRPLARRRAP